MDVLFKEQVGNTVNEYMMEIESCVEQIRIIAETTTNECPISNKDSNIRVCALSAAIITLCRHCDGVIQNYYSYEKMVK